MAVACGGQGVVTKTVTQRANDDGAVHLFLHHRHLRSGSYEGSDQSGQTESLSKSLVERVKFVSKEASLEAVRKKHPREVGDLPTNPFPDALTVIPKHP